MPITRTYQCPECNHRFDVVLAAEQWDDAPPDCPRCAAWDFQHQTQQVFKPPAIGGSARSRAAAIAEDIAANDYHVANLHAGNREGDQNKVTYKDTTPGVAPSSWTGPNAHQMQLGQEALQSVLAMGRQTRLQHGSGLDVLKHGLATGDLPDLVEESKKKSARIW